MAKRRTKAQKLGDYFQAFKCVQEGKPVKRSGAKDGSIRIKPFLSTNAIPEREVLKQCLDWLRKHGIVADRLNVGTGELGTSGYRVYGIVGGGDIIAILPSGMHLEVETKSGKGGRLSLRQQRRKEKIQRNNGYYFVVCGVNELACLVEPLL